MITQKTGLSAAYVSIAHLSKGYRVHESFSPVLSDIFLEIEQYEFVVVLGPSGCGKSTLLRCIAGFESYEGDIVVDGQFVSAPAQNRMMMFQDPNQLFPWKTALQNVAYPLMVQGVRKRDALRRASTILATVGLEKYAQYHPHQLSGGMKQRVALARALAVKPSLMLMDEPFASLDVINREALQSELLALCESNRMTVLFVTHSIEETLCLSTRILVMGRTGQLIFDEPNTLARPVTPATHGYGELWKRLNQALRSSHSGDGAQ